MWKLLKDTPDMRRWESPCGDYEVLHKPGTKVYMLISFKHDPNEAGQEFWRRPFASLLAAQEYTTFM